MIKKIHQIGYLLQIIAQNAFFLMNLNITSRFFFGASAPLLPAIACVSTRPPSNDNDGFVTTKDDERESANQEDYDLTLHIRLLTWHIALILTVLIG